VAIIGIGIDLIEVARIAALLKKSGDAFKAKVFSRSEIVYSEKSRCKIERYAARFSAKEAFVKAFGQKGVSLKDISVSKEASGKPFLIFSPTLTRRLKKCFSSVIIHLTLTHTKTTAGALVVIETRD